MAASKVAEGSAGGSNKGQMSVPAVADREVERLPRRRPISKEGGEEALAVVVVVDCKCLPGATKASLLAKPTIARHRGNSFILFQREIINEKDGAALFALTRSKLVDTINATIDAEQQLVRHGRRTERRAKDEVMT